MENEIRGPLKVFGLKTGPISVVAFEARILKLTDGHPRPQAMARPLRAARQAMRPRDRQCESITTPSVSWSSAPEVKTRFGGKSSLLYLRLMVRRVGKPFLSR